MMPLNFQAKHHLLELIKEDRWTILTALLFDSNVDNRCWPSGDRIHRMTGKSQTTITRAKQWLLKHKAIELVPYNERKGREKALPRRQHVYRLTGVLEIDGKQYPYFYQPKPKKKAAKHDKSTHVENPPSETSTLLNFHPVATKYEELKYNSSPIKEQSSKDTNVSSQGDHDQVDTPIPPKTEQVVDTSKMVKVESDTNPPQNRQPEVVDMLKEEINTPLPSSAAPSPEIAPGVIRVVVQADLQQQQHLMKERTHNSIKLFCKTSPAMANAVGTTAGFANKPLCMDCLIAWECTQVDEHTKNAFSKMIYGSERQRKIQEDADKMDAALLELGEAMGHAVTVEDVDRYDEWWKHEDWRGRRDERPTLKIVQATWLGALASDNPVLPVSLPPQGSNPHELAAAMYDDRPNPYAKDDDELPPRQIKLHKETDKEMKSWFATKGQLEVQLNQATFAMWIRPLKAIGYADPDTLVLEAANGGVAEWFHKHIEPAVKETYNRIDRRDNHKPSIKFVVVIDGDNEYRDGADMRKAEGG